MSDLDLSGKLDGKIYDDDADAGPYNATELLTTYLQMHQKNI